MKQGTRARLANRYDEQIRPALQEQLGLSSHMAVPRLDKIVINMGLGEAIQNAKILDVAVAELSAISGQKAVITRAKKAIANFKLREGCSGKKQPDNEKQPATLPVTNNHFLTRSITMKKLLSTWNLIIAAIIILTAVSFTGCRELTITPDQLQSLASQTEQLSSKIDGFQLQTQTAIEAMKTNGTVDVNSLDKVDKLQSQIDAVQVKAQSIAQAVKNAQYTNPADTATTVIEASRAANAASVPWNPYAPLVDLGLGIAAAAAAVIAKRNAQAAAQAQAIYQAHKQGVELTMKQVSQSADAQVRAIVTQLYENIGEARIANGVNQ